MKRTVLAEYYITDTLSLLYLVRADFAQPEVVVIDRSLEDTQKIIFQYFGAESGQEDQERRSTGEKVRSLDEEAFQEFFKPFVAPLIAESPFGDLVTNEGDIIWIVQHNVLHYLPMHALKINGRYLIERNPVCYSPSASVMEFCRSNRHARRNRALVFGDPRHDLPQAREEALMVADLFGTEAYVGDVATKTLLKQKLLADSEIDILHFACHGRFDTANALNSGIEFAAEPDDDQGGEELSMLTTEEIFEIELKANLITLSACESGVNERKPGDEMIGLTRALLYAGSPSVVVSLWNVSDISAGLLMRHFYQSLTQLTDEGGSTYKVAALQSAQLKIMNMTAREVDSYCAQRVAELAESDDFQRAVSFRVERTRIQIQAGDLNAVIDAYRKLLVQLKNYDDVWAQRLSADIEQALPVLEVKAEVTTDVDYSIKPYAQIYHWAPFILVGDWE